MLQAAHNGKSITFSGWVALFCALVLLVILDASSSGIMRNNGGDDEGSGVGGTGRMPVPGSESGLGGTGLRPFLGVNAGSEIEVIERPRPGIKAITEQLALDIEPVQPVTEPALPAPVTVADSEQFTTDSSAIFVAEQIQREINMNALYFQRSRESLRTLPAASMRATTEIIAADPVLTADTEAPTDLNIEESGSRQEEPTQVSWGALTQYLARQEASGESDSKDGLARAESVQKRGDTGGNARQARPERIQRPELPPVQRVRPLQRAAILPPRIKPLAL